MLQRGENITIKVIYEKRIGESGKLDIGLAYSMFFLGVLPLLAYPLQKYIPAYKDKGCERQRNLTIIFAVAGFTMGCVMSFAFPASALRM